MFVLIGGDIRPQENLLAVIEPILHGLDMLHGEGSADCALPEK